MLVKDIGNDLMIDEMPQGTSLAAVCHWIRGTISYLNVMLYEDFSISPINYEILDNSHTREYYQQHWYENCQFLQSGQPTINLEAVGIIKQLFRIYNLQLQVQNNMNSINQNDLLSVGDNFGGGTFTRINRNEVAKTLISMRKDEIQILNKMIGAYLIRKSGVKGISGDDYFTPYYLSYQEYVRGV
jgi:hypothetical protein